MLMKVFYSIALLMMVLVIILVKGKGTALAFHEGGVGSCDACHSMHSSPASGGAALLKSVDPSSGCLLCHEQTGDAGPTGYHISTPSADMPPGSPPRQLTPGGDFGWLKKNYNWTPGATQPLSFSSGERHGHNIVAINNGYYADATNLTAPGGTFPASSLSCISCHDPHGRYRRNVDGSISVAGTPIRGSGSYAASPDPDAGSSVGVYRLLGGRNFQPLEGSSALVFLNDPPFAVAPDTFNRSEAVTQTRAAYGAGMSEWCQNCHASIHSAANPGISNLLHPSGASAKLGFTRAGVYNTYLRTGDLSGTSDSSFLSLVPFEEGSRDYMTLKTHARSDDTYLAGPDSTNAQVMCLSCHRAHASAWDGMLRWNGKTDYIVYNGLYSQEGQPYQPFGQGRTELEAQKASYDRPASKFGMSQDTLCNKCHNGVYP